MTRRIQLVAALLLVLAGVSQLASAGEVIDRMVASVNRQVVLESELRVAIAYQCLVNHTAIRPLRIEERDAALNRLIEQKLLEQQMQNAQVAAASSQEVAQRIEELKKDSAPAQNASGGSQLLWTLELQKYGLTSTDVEQQITVQIALLRFVDARFRADIRIEDAKVESYYRDVLLPQLKTSGAPIAKLGEVAARIRELLVQQRINDELANWLKSLREQSTIKIRQ